MKREEEKKILEEMDAAMREKREKEADEARTAEKSHENHREEPSKTARGGKDSEIRCPRCGRLLENRHACPYCRYTGYIPMSKRETRRLKLILYPIVLAAAILLLVFANR